MKKLEKWPIAPSKRLMENIKTVTALFPDWQISRNIFGEWVIHSPKDGTLARHENYCTAIEIAAALKKQ